MISNYLQRFGFFRLVPSRTVLFCAFVLVMATVWTNVLTGQPDTAKPATGRDNFKTIALAHSAEDLVHIPSSDWVIAGNLVFAAELRTAGGGLYLINTQSRAATRVNMRQVLAGKPDPQFQDCPGPPTADEFGAHGIDLTRSPNRPLQLLVVNHGGRESIEVFRVSVQQPMPSLHWIGCVVFPSHLILNAVAPLRDGGFVVTSMLDRDDKAAFKKMISGGITGVVYRWKPGATPAPMRGTEASVDNGIEVGPDGAIYVAAWGSKEVFRFHETGNTLARESVPVDFLPDNLWWAPDGALLVAGQRRDLSKLGQKCNGGPCPVAWAVARLDPKTMKAQTFIEGDGTAFSEATTALEIKEEIWLGSASDTRVAIFKTNRHTSAVH